MLIGLRPDKSLSGKWARQGRNRQGFLFARLWEGAFIFILLKKRKEFEKMKTKLTAILLTLTLLCTLASCATAPEAPKDPATTAENAQVEKNTAPEDSASVPAEGLWKDATYRENKTFGTGSKTVKVTVKAENSSVTFTLNTDKDNLADALLEHKLVEGEDSAYGLYIKKVNGILADYNVDQTYWSFEINGEAQMTGVSAAKIAGGESFELVRKK